MYEFQTIHNVPNHTIIWVHYEKSKWRSNVGLLQTTNFRIIYVEKLSFEVREVSENVTKTLPNIENPHIGIYREIGQQVSTSIEDGQTHTQTDATKLYI